MQEYIVTLRSSEELDAFYSDMETSGGTSSVPSREVECTLRRPISRNTNYNLEDAEANALKSDERVLDVIPKAFMDIVEVRPYGWTQTSTEWNKSNLLGSNMKNWGLLRCTNQQQIVNWGSNGTTNQTATIQATSSGANVDVIVGDGFVPQGHPEYAINADGTGGSRFIAEDWGQLRSQVDGGVNFNYVYPTGTGDNELGAPENNHGAHVAGTMIGNTQGWARDAGFRVISPYGVQQGNPNAGFVSGSETYDYVRVFHTTKPVNTETGIRNPTIMNNSWGNGFSVAGANFGLISVNFQGVTNNAPDPALATGGFSSAQLNAFGLVDQLFDENNQLIGFNVQTWAAGIEADVVDAINAGVIMVGAAGNDSMLIDRQGGPNFDNSITFTFQGTQFTNFYHRGSANTTAGTACCVGAEDFELTEAKAEFSNTGPRIDAWAPGSGIMSSVQNGNVRGPGNSIVTIATVADPQNNSFEITKYDGTSMASPQVCGVLSCWLEQNPRATQADCLNYLAKNSVGDDQLAAGGNGGFTDDTDLQGAPRDILMYGYLRESSVSPTTRTVDAYPHANYYSRPDTGMLSPRSAPISYEVTAAPQAPTVTITGVGGFTSGQTVPQTFFYDQVGCPGSNNSPALSWSFGGGAIPAGSTLSFTCIDLQGGPWIHWTVTDIPTNTTSLAQNANWPAGTTVGNSDWVTNGIGTQRSNGWGGPCPPNDGVTHNYQFQIQIVNGGQTLATSNAYVGTAVGLGL